MAIEWYDSQKPLPTVTVAPYGLNLSSSSVEYFSGTAKIKLGIDTSQKRILIKPATADEEGTFTFPEINENQKTARISCKDFVQFVAIKIGIDIEKSEKYFAFWENKEGILIVELTKKAQKKRQRNKAV